MGLQIPKAQSEVIRCLHRPALQSLNIQTLTEQVQKKQEILTDEMLKLGNP